MNFCFVSCDDDFAVDVGRGWIFHIGLNGWLLCALSVDAFGYGAEQTGLDARTPYCTKPNLRLSEIKYMVLTIMIEWIKVIV